MISAPGPDIRNALCDPLVGGVCAKQLAQVVSPGCEQAQKQLAFRRQARPGAVPAKRLGHASDKTDFTTLVCIAPARGHLAPIGGLRSEEHTSELQSLMRISYA